MGGAYEYDIFVSYSHGPSAYGGNETDLKRWTHAFVHELEEDLNYVLGHKGRSRVKIFYDEHLHGDMHLTSGLKETVSKAAVFLVIMTDHYLASAWCTTERQWFEAELLRRGHAADSIFVIRAMPTDRSRWPAFLKDERQKTVTGFAFHREGGGPATRPFGWPRPADREGPFYEALSKGSSVLAERLETIRAENETEAVPKPAATSVEVFVSYSHKDDAMREKLGNHLTLLKRHGVMDTWHDRRIVSGQKWTGIIDEHLDSAAVILLLISADFLASDYCYELEMRRALARHNAGEAKVIPVILRSVDWQGTPFSQLPALPRGGKPVTSWSNEEEAFTNIARGIRSVIEELRETPVVGPSSLAGAGGWCNDFHQLRPRG